MDENNNQPLNLVHSITTTVHYRMVFTLSFLNSAAYQMELHTLTVTRRN